MDHSPAFNPQLKNDSWKHKHLYFGGVGGLGAGTGAGKELEAGSPFWDSAPELPGCATASSDVAEFALEAATTSPFSSAHTHSLKKGVIDVMITSLGFAVHAKTIKNLLSHNYLQGWE